MKKYGRGTLWHMHLACWITKATDTRSEYVIFLALPQQKWLCECVLVLWLYKQCLSFLLLNAICCNCMQPYLYTVILILLVAFLVMTPYNLVDPQEPVACIYRMEAVGSMFL
jgi:hypothetical protein